MTRPPGNPCRAYDAHGNEMQPKDASRKTKHPKREQAKS
jgi:hypothetical protein